MDDLFVSTKETGSEALY